MLCVSNVPPGLTQSGKQHMSKVSYALPGGSDVIIDGRAVDSPLQDSTEQE